MTLKEAPEGNEYTIKAINTNDDELNSFLFSLGCYGGETISVISRLKSGSIVAIKGSRYSIDSRLAESILLQ